MNLEKETGNFKFKIEDPKEEKNGDLEARIHTKPLNADQDAYEERTKFTQYSITRYANAVADVHSLTEEEAGEVQTQLLKLKNDVRERAEPKNQGNTQNQQGSEVDDKELENKYFRILEFIQAKSGDKRHVQISELQEEVDKPFEAIDKLDPQHSQTYTMENKIFITDEGEAKLKEHLGFKEFDGDPVAEAQKQLETNNPLRYYLDSFNKIHKGDHLLKIWELMSALSATCADRQIHSWAVGPSGAGKSHLKRRLLDFLPRESYERKESFSPKALQYKSTTQGSDFLNNKLVYFDEVGEDDVEGAIELMRLMTDQDQDVIVHETVKDQEILTISLEVDQITVWFTSVETIQDEQLKNRFILTNPDASSAQDKTVNEHQQNILNYGGDLDFIPSEAVVIQRMIRTLREETPEYKPIVPFKIDWKQEFNRRLYPFFYTLMGLVAKTHYRNRETKNSYIFVTKADFELAKLIWGQLIDTTVAQTDEQSIKLLKALPEERSTAMSRQDLRMQLSGFSTNKVKETCEKLEETEELQLINTDYEEGRYVHWAGADVEKLVDNEPEIEQLDRETVKKMVEEAGVTPEDRIVDNVFEAEIPVHDFLQEKVRQKKEEDEDEDKIQITDAEETALQQMNNYDWDIDINGLQQMCDEDVDIVEAASTLEEKGVIRLSGENIPTPKSLLKQLKAENEVML